MPCRERAKLIRLRARIEPSGHLATDDLLRLLPAVGMEPVPRIVPLAPPVLAWVARSQRGGPALTLAAELPSPLERATLVYAATLVDLDQQLPALITRTPEQYAGIREAHSERGRIAELAGWLLVGDVRMHDLREMPAAELIDLLGVRPLIALGWRELALEAHRQRHLWAAKAI